MGLNFDDDKFTLRNVENVWQHIDMENAFDIGRIGRTCINT